MLNSIFSDFQLGWVFYLTNVRDRRAEIHGRLRWGSHTKLIRSLGIEP
jgi:hypothetical protein